MQRSVLITGTSMGIGLATAALLALRGWRVFATMRNLTKRVLLEQTLEKTGLRDRVEIEQLDVTSGTSIAGAVKSILARTGNKLDAVVHNAGVAAAGAVEDVPESELRRVMETNFFGVLELTRALLPTFRVQGSGRIVIVSSEAAFMGQPANAIYCASKWAIEGWAEAIAYELEPLGIEIVLIEPGPYRTEIWNSTPRIQPARSPYRAWTQQVFRAGDAHAASLARDPKEGRSNHRKGTRDTTAALSVPGRTTRSSQSLYERQSANSHAAKSNEALFGSTLIQRSVWFKDVGPVSS
jgi:NAD(P)-dependent dehydrogenase (short-subunit alcohol dehydrogenase family)